MKTEPLIIDLAPAYISFEFQACKGDGTVLNPTGTPTLAIYEEGGANNTYDNSQISGSPFNLAQINSVTGNYGVLVDKSLFTAGKIYRAIYSGVVDGITTGKVELFQACNASQFKATGFSTFNPASDTVARVTLTDTATTLTNAPSDSTGVTSLLGIFTGMTSLPKWLRGIFRKDAMDATAKTEVNDGGGTYNETTDSNEAIRDTAPLGTAMRGTDGAITSLSGIATATNVSDAQSAIISAIPDVSALALETSVGALGTPMQAGDVTLAASQPNYDPLAELTDLTYGLSTLKTLLSNIDTSAELAARFTEIKGAGWTDENLKALGDLLDAIKLQTDKMNFNGASDIKATLDGEEVALSSGEHTSIASDTQTGMTAQGYTTTRAGYLDVLNGLVTSIWAAGARTLTSFGTLVSDILDAITGGGAYQITITVDVTSTTTGISGYELSIYDSTNTVFQATQTTNSSGIAVFNLASGTYKVRGRKAGYTPANTTETLIVSGDGSATYYATTFVPTPPPSLDMQTLYGTIIDGAGNAVANCPVEIIPSKQQVINSRILAMRKLADTTNISGYFELTIERTAHITFTAGSDGEHYRKNITISSDATKDVSTY